MALSPKRVISTSTSRFLQALDSLHGSAPATSNVDNPLGVEWPPPSSTASTSRVQGPVFSSPTTVAASTAERSSKESHVKSTLPKNGRSTNSKAVLASSSRQIDSTATSNLPVARKLVSQDSKENGDIQDSSPIILKPPIVHPLPMYSYKTYNSKSPARVYTRHEEEANDLVDSLTGPVGFDIEWRVIFRRGSPMRPAATVQLSDHRMILVIQVSAMKGFPKTLKQFLEDPDIVKVGVNILNDGNKLARDYGIRAQGLVELGGLARQADAYYVERHYQASDYSSATVQDYKSKTRVHKSSGMMSLAVITSMYTGHALSKGAVRTSNWEAVPLSEAQLEYASNDAHSALMVYVRLIAMAEEAKVQLEPTRYTSGVNPLYGRRSVTPSIYLPPPAIANSSSSASSSSTSTSGYNAEASLDESTPTTSVTSLDLPSVSSSRSNSATLMTTTPITDDDIDEIIKKRAAKLKGKALSETNTALRRGKIVRQTPQHIRAYRLWHDLETPLPDICSALRSSENPLKRSTVISYVIGALRTDPTLPFSHERLKMLLDAEKMTWFYHREWFDALKVRMSIGEDGKEE